VALTGSALAFGRSLALLGPRISSASSHGEAPLTAADPQADNTDTYAFVSPDNAGSVTKIANWIPFEEPAGGPKRTARFQVRAGSGLVAAETVAGALSSSPLHGLDRFTTAYTNLVSRTTLTPAFTLLAIILSMMLGGLHAVAPGHGKTLMAAYLVGREGTWRQAAPIGLSVTVTHTIGVLVLGVALSAAALAAPEEVYPWLGLFSGIMLAGVGVTLLKSARTGHIHGPGGHTQGPGDHAHAPGGHTHAEGAHVLAPGPAPHGVQLRPSRAR